MAAPHVTGVVALMFQVALERRIPPKTLKVQEIRKILIPPDNVHDPVLGYGRVDATEAIKKVIENQ